MVDVNPWLIAIVPTAVAAGAGALVNGVRERRKPQSDQERVAMSAIFGAIIWGGITLVVAGGIAILASTLKGAGEMGKTVRIFHHNSDASREVQKKEVRASATPKAEAVAVQAGNYRQWLRIERGRQPLVNGKVRIQPRGRQQMRMPVKVA